MVKDDYTTLVRTHDGNSQWVRKTTDKLGNNYYWSRNERRIHDAEEIDTRGDGGENYGYIKVSAKSTSVLNEKIENRLGELCSGGVLLPPIIVEYKWDSSKKVIEKRTSYCGEKEIIVGGDKRIARWEEECKANNVEEAKEIFQKKYEEHMGR